MLDNACAGDDVKISLDVAYSEVDGVVEIKLTCAGKEHNPLDKNFDEIDEDNLGAMILHNLSKNYSHEYEGGVNKISFSLA